MLSLMMVTMSFLSVCQIILTQLLIDGASELLLRLEDASLVTVQSAFLSRLMEHPRLLLSCRGLKTREWSRRISQEMGN